MLKLLYHLMVAAIISTPLVLAGCGDGSNRVVEESEELTFDKLDEMAAKETAEAEESEE